MSNDSYRARDFLGELYDRAVNEGHGQSGSLFWKWKAVFDAIRNRKRVTNASPRIETAVTGPEETR